MKKEYKIQWAIPENYRATDILRNLPSPISREMTEICNYAVEKDGFYFRDNLVEPRIAGYAMKLFIDEALQHTKEVNIHLL